jgi:YD repeat-containing protein
VKNKGGHTADVNVRPSDPGRFQGDPIDITTGNLVHIETDYVGAGPFPLVLRRTYNSQSVRLGRLSANWSHSYSAHIQRSTLFEPIFSVVEVVRADGKVLFFSRHFTSSEWQSNGDINSRLQSRTDGSGGWRYTTGFDDVEIYDAAGRLLSMTTRAGLTQDLHYAQGRLESVTDPFGRTLTFAYDGNRISSITDPDPAGGTYRYQYRNDNLTSVTGPDNKRREYLYEGRSFPHALTGVIDENGVRFATFRYDFQGRARLSELSDGADRVLVNYDTGGGTRVTDALGTARHYRHEMILGVKRTQRATKPSAFSTWDYDKNGNIKSYTDYRKKNRTDFAYDLARNLEISRTEAIGTPDTRTITTEWDLEFRLPKKIFEPKRVTTFVYDHDGKDGTESHTVTDRAKAARSRTWTFEYRADGQIDHIDGPRPEVEDITRYAYDDQGRLKSQTNALGHSTTFGDYDAHGRPRMIEDPNGLITKLAYDERGRLKTHEVRGQPERPPKSPDRPRTPVGPDPSLLAGELTTYEYDAVGQLCKLTSPDGSFVRFTYDGAHRLVAITDNGDADCLSLTPPKLANAIIYTLDKIGNPVGEQVFDREGRLARTHCRKVDPLNRLKSSGSAVPETGLCPRVEGDKAPTTTFEYDDNDNLIKITDPLGHSTTPPWDYDALDRLISSTDLNGGQTVYSYDANDRLETVTDPEKLQTTYGYDGLGNQTRISSPDTGVTFYFPDEAGNTGTLLDNRVQATTYTYDALNRVTDVKFSDGAVKFIYDQETNEIGQRTNGIGRLTQMTDATGTTHWSYDPLGRVVRKTQQLAGLNRPLTTQYRYEAGRLTSMTYPSGERIDLAHTDGQVTEISAGGTPAPARD